MVKVIVTGANGYIGNAVATAVRAAGHKVYGLIRSEQYAQQLLEKEIIPIVGDLNNLTPLLTHFEDAAVIIDTSFDGTAPGKVNQQLFRAVEEIATKIGRSKRYIYTSGVLVYGDYPTQIVDETFPTKASKWRVDVENSMLSSTILETVIMRPGWVYGLSSGHYVDNWYKPNANGDIVVQGKPDKKWSWIHVVDLGHAFASVVDAPSSTVKNQIFNVADSTRVTYEQARILFARAAGITGSVVYEPAGSDAFSQVLESTTIISANKLTKTTGWTPRFNLVDEIDTAYVAMKAAKQKPLV